MILETVAHRTDLDVEEYHIPSSFVPFFLSTSSPTFIRIGAWREDVYAGRQMAGGLGKVKVGDLPLVRV